MIYLTENLRNNKERFNTVVFDVDGVLVDTSASYTQAVIQAVADYGDNLNGFVWKPELYHYEQFKSIRGFNNDWDVAEALLFYFLQKEVLAAPLSFYAFVSGVAGGGEGIDSVVSWIQSLGKKEADKISSLYNKEEIREFAMELYAGSARCQTFFNCDPRCNNCPGTIENEKLLVDRVQLEKLQVDTAIYTGRNFHELQYALKKIGYSGWKEELCFYDDADSPTKPDPMPLVTMADSSGCTGIVFAGDSWDDFETARNFSRQRPEFPFEFVQIMQLGSRFDCSHSALSNINQLLYFLLWEIS